MPTSGTSADPVDDPIPILVKNHSVYYSASLSVRHREIPLGGLVNVPTKSISKQATSQLTETTRHVYHAILGY
jgi:hypothetical protein